MSGPAPRPTALNDLLGNPGKRTRGPEPEPEKKAPRPPSFLSAEARKEWRRVVPRLEKLGLATEIDRAALVVYCEAWATYVGTLAILREVGDAIEGTRGTMVRHPAAIAHKEASDTLQKVAKEFGMTPSARSRITLPGEDPAKDVESFLN